ncbi:MAG TPA: hypothetical protein VGM22_17690 [Methylomirabilota bacterium]|jgi:hypothetical protein
MIELMGVGVPRTEGGWLLRELCTTFESASRRGHCRNLADDRRPRPGDVGPPGWR